MDTNKRPVKVHFDELAIERLSSEQRNSIEDVEIQFSRHQDF